LSISSFNFSSSIFGPKSKLDFNPVVYKRAYIIKEYNWNIIIKENKIKILLKYMNTLIQIKIVFIIFQK